MGLITINFGWNAFQVGWLSKKLFKYGLVTSLLLLLFGIKLICNRIAFAQFMINPLQAILFVMISLSRVEVAVFTACFVVPIE